MLCERTPANGAAQARKLGLDELLCGNDDFSVNKALFYSPSMNIQGISGGYTGAGHKTVNPAQAFARLECRLVRNQDPEDIGRKISDHLQAQGFHDIEVVSTKAGAWPMRTPVDDPFLEIVQSAGKADYGQDVVILPSSPGTGPRFAFKHVPEMPIVALGVGHADSRAHAPNENIYIEDQFLTTRHVAGILEQFGRLDAEVITPQRTHEDPEVSFS
jgi:acetylornithine deacetylase/succinyl-diaminopimelate desuccinylase-like protein